MDPIQLSGYSAEDIRRFQKTFGYNNIEESIHVTPGHDADLLICSILAENYHRTPTVSVATNCFWIDSTDHVFSDNRLFFPFVLLTLTIGDCGLLPLLQDNRPSLGFIRISICFAPASDDSGDILVVLGRVWQADWLSSWGGN